MKKNPYKVINNSLSLLDGKVNIQFITQTTPILELTCEQYLGNIQFCYNVTICSYTMLAQHLYFFFPFVAIWVFAVRTFCLHLVHLDLFTLQYSEYFGVVDKLLAPYYLGSYFQFFNWLHFSHCYDESVIGRYLHICTWPVHLSS